MFGSSTCYGLLLLLLWSFAAEAVKRKDFKECHQSGFCNRNRNMADRAQEHAQDWVSPYSLGSLQLTEPSSGLSSFSAPLTNSLFPDIAFSLQLDFTDDGQARVRVDEVDGLRQRFNEAADWTLVKESTLASSDDVQASLSDNNSGESSFVYGFNKNHRLVISHAPLKLTFERDGQPHIVLNDRGLFNMEHFRVQHEDDSLVVQDPEQPSASRQESVNPHFLPETDDGMWKERFKGHQDTKPKGPESLSMDINFLGYEHVMGIPEHAGPLSLRTTRGGDNAYTDPYRLFNLDVFEYEPDSEMALYGSVPFMQAHRAGSTVGVFWLNGAETWIDVTKSKSKRNKPVNTSTHWISESGIMDLFVFLGPEPKDVYRDFTALVGRTAMPQYFAIGYHQCRWNYLNEEDVLAVSARFDEEDMPMDVLWLDIEYAEDHKYFAWDHDNFPHPTEMLQGLDASGRQLVAIVDPHIKRVEDFYIYKEAKDLDILLKNKDGSEYEGWCWTGSSSWVDFFDPRSWSWWLSQFKFDKWTDSARNLWIWNDMNEPAIFNGPEMTSPKDVLYNSGWENRDLHNINGVIFHNLTAQALIEREDTPRRPFVLSRSFWAGTQRFGAVWTGDNLGTWKHLASASPMILANGVGGMAWSGADIGGFFGNPSQEMLVRWYQAGAFHPFFRAHAHIDTKRREPYLFDEPIKTYLKNMLKLRYSLLPTWYTAFWDSHRTGLPIAMPEYVLFPEDINGIAVDDQFYLGHSGLLVKPIVEEGVTKTDIYVPDEQPYYNFFTHTVHHGHSKTGSRFPFEAPLDTLPLFHRGGSIVSQRETIRRSAPLMWRDPIKLTVALDNSQSASGSIYLDDGDSFDFEKGALTWRSFDFDFSGSTARLTSKDLASSGTSAQELSLYTSDNQWQQQAEPITVHKIVVLGLEKKPTCIKSSLDGAPVHFEWIEGIAASAGRRKSGKPASELIINPTAMSITKDWDLQLEFSGGSCNAPAPIDAAEQLQSPLCPPQHFRCENKGHIPGCLLVSRVNDGICDAECCDGSDEFDGKTACPNRCKEVGQAYRKEQAEELAKTQLGSQIRDEYITFGQREKAEAERNLVKYSRGLEEVEAKERALKRALEQVEAKSGQEIERKKNSSVYRKIEDYQQALKSLRLDRTVLEDELAQLFNILVDLQKGYNPNYQDMAVKGAVKGFEEWAEAHGHSFAAQEDGAQPEITLGQTHQSLSDQDIQKMEKDDILELLDSSGDVALGGEEGETLAFRLEDYLPQAIKPHYNTVVQQILDFLRSIGALAPAQDAGKDRPDVVKARKAVSDIQNDVRKARRKVDAERSNLDKDWGVEWEWKKLDGQCLTKDAGEYTYELCMFGQAKQKSKKGGAGGTNLGKYKSWRPKSEGQVTHAYGQQIYDRGAKCWNGPDRSVILDISCDTENKLVSVMELEKCEYSFKMTSPAACLPPQQGESGKVPKDEL